MTEQQIEEEKLPRTAAEAIANDENTMREVGRAVRDRRKWGTVRQDSLVEWAASTGNSALSENDQLRAFFGVRPDAAIRRRWATIDEADLIATLKEQGETGPFAALSGYVRKHFGVSAMATTRFEDGKIAVFLGKVPTFFSDENAEVYDPGPDSPWTKNMLAVWLEEGEPDTEPNL